MSKDQYDEQADRILTAWRESGREINDDLVSAVAAALRKYGYKNEMLIMQHDWWRSRAGDYQKQIADERGENYRLNLLVVIMGAVAVAAAVLFTVALL